MNTPVSNAVGRNRSKVMVGAPEVKYSGGFWIGEPVYEQSLFPTGADQDGKEAAAKFGAVTAGFISQDGVNENIESSTEKILDWNLDVIDVVETEFGATLTVTFVEAMNAAVLKFIYGDENVKVTEDEVYIQKKAGTKPTKSVMFDLKGKNGAKGRGFAAEAQVSNVGEIAYIKGDLIKYETTIDVLNDVTGTYLHTWFKQGAQAKASTASAEPDPSSPAAKTVALPANPTAGTFTISIDGQATSALEYNAQASAVQDALRAVKGGESATVTGKAGGPYTINGVKGAITADGAGLTADSTTINVA